MGFKDWFAKTFLEDEEHEEIQEKNEDEITEEEEEEEEEHEYIGINFEGKYSLEVNKRKRNTFDGYSGVEEITIYNIDMHLEGHAKMHLDNKDYYIRVKCFDTISYGYRTEESIYYDISNNNYIEEWIMEMSNKMVIGEVRDYLKKEKLEEAKKLLEEKFKDNKISINISVDKDQIT